MAGSGVQLAIVALRTHHMLHLMSPHKSPPALENKMRIGFIGLGNVGGKLAGSLQRNGFDLMVRDLDQQVATPFIDRGAQWAESPAEMTRQPDMAITCLPNLSASAAVMEDPDGLPSEIADGKIRAAMSHTD